MGRAIHVDVEQIWSEVDNGLKWKKRDSVDDAEFNKM